VLSRHSVCAVRMSGHGRRRIFGASSVAAPCTVARSVVAWFIVGCLSVGWAMVGGGRRRHAQHRGRMQRAAAEGGWQPVAHSQACIRETGHVRGLGVVFRRDGCQLCERPRAPCDLALAGDVGRPGSLSRPARGYGRRSGGAPGRDWTRRCVGVGVSVRVGACLRGPAPPLAWSLTAHGGSSSLCSSLRSSSTRVYMAAHRRPLSGAHRLERLHSAACPHPLTSGLLHPSIIIILILILILILF
jgi:hypothetical protein